MRSRVHPPGREEGSRMLIGVVTMPFGEFVRTLTYSVTRRRSEAAEQRTGARFPIALAGGAAGALVGAIIWAVIVVATNYEIGYVAVLVGYLAGHGVKLGAGKGRGQTLQIAAAGMSVFGLVIAKYFILAHFVVSSPDSAELGLGYFSPALFIVFLQNIGSSLSPFDLLWIAFALMTAWRIPAPSKIEVGQ